jgi:hypothetical protein
MPGQEVRFRVGGVLAAESYAYEPFWDEPPDSNLLDDQDLTAMENHAWYWLEQPLAEPLVAGALIQALVDGHVCGEASIRAREPPGIAGFPQLVVAADSFRPGCGRPGARLSFAVGGIAAENTVDWQPGLQRITLQFPPPSTPSPSPTAAPPLTPVPPEGRGMPARLPATGGRHS